MKRGFILVALVMWSGSLSPVGIELVVGVGLVVGGFATAQFLGLRAASAQ